MIDASHAGKAHAIVQHLSPLFDALNLYRACGRCTASVHESMEIYRRFQFRGMHLRLSLLFLAGGGVAFKANRIVYAVKGLAMASGFALVEPIWKIDWAMYKEFTKVLETTVEQAKKHVGPMQISIRSIIDGGTGTVQSRILCLNRILPIGHYFLYFPKNFINAASSNYQ